MRHLYRCPMRWADLDLLGHVNNVVYVDYLQEARVDLMRALFPPRRDDLAEGVVVVRHEVTYLATLGFDFAPVHIEVWVTEVRAATFTLAYEVFRETSDAEGGREVYLRATTVLTPYVFATEQPRRITPEERAALTAYLEPAPGERSPRIPALDPAQALHFPLHVRFSDADVYRHVNNVKYFEYFQESRVALLDQLVRDTGETVPSAVVAQTDVDYRRPILLRHDPYDLWTCVTRLGTRSMTLESEISDGETLLARARVTLVFFDVATGRSAAPSEGLRALIAPHVVTAPVSPSS